MAGRDRPRCRRDRAAVTPVPRTSWRSVVVISDWIDGHPADGPFADAPDHPPDDGTVTGDIAVVGGYLERLPLALVAAGIVDRAEIWHYWRGREAPPFHRDGPALARRAFRITDERTPFHAAGMIDFVHRYGAPHILIVLGLGVAPELLDLCANSVIVYNSIDAPALRVPAAVSARFDLVITGAPWQSDVVSDRHPGMATLVMPIGPEFASIDQFRPLGTSMDLDLIYVAAAQPYKRHDILFDALARCPRDVRALCVFGYSEMGDELRRRAADQGLDIEFVGPPGVPADEVNRLMNRARFGVVCGVDDGAPAILTEYMLAGLPVLANADLSCGRQYILPETGITATAEGFADAIMRLRETAGGYDPRLVVLDRWTWPHSVATLTSFIVKLYDSKQRQHGNR